MAHRFFFFFFFHSIRSLVLYVQYCGRDRFSWCQSFCIPVPLALEMPYKMNIFFHVEFFMANVTEPYSPFTLVKYVHGTRYVFAYFRSGVYMFHLLDNNMFVHLTNGMVHQFVMFDYYTVFFFDIYWNLG